MFRPMRRIKQQVSDDECKRVLDGMYKAGGKPEDIVKIYMKYLSIRHPK